MKGVSHTLIADLLTELSKRYPLEKGRHAITLNPETNRLELFIGMHMPSIILDDGEIDLGVALVDKIDELIEAS